MLADLEEHMAAVMTIQCALAVLVMVMQVLMSQCKPQKQIC